MSGPSANTAPTADEVFGPASSVRFSDRAPLNALLETSGIHKLTSLSPAEDVRDALETLKAEVVAAHLDETDRATLSKLVLDTLAELKIRNARPIVRAVIGDATPSAAVKAVASSITLSDDAPASEPADGAALLEATSTVIMRHVILTPVQADAIARARTAPVRFEAANARGTIAASSVSSVVFPDRIVGAVINRIGISASASIT